LRRPALRQEFAIRGYDPLTGTCPRIFLPSRRRGHHFTGGLARRIGEIDAFVLAFDQSARYDSAKFFGSAPAIRVSST
jgi:hypothetical protein